MNRLRQFAQRYLLADAAPLSVAERWRSTLAALLGMFLIQAVLTVIPGDPEIHHLLAPLGATSVILFALPHSPLGQPWATVGGLLLPALVGMLCATWIRESWLAVPVALAISVWVMAWLRCLHPPGGAMAVVFAGSGLVIDAAAVEVALVNTAAALLAALAINTAIPGRKWPQCFQEVPGKRSPQEQRRPGISHEDLQFALTEIDSFLDITEDDLVQVYDLALGHAHERHERRCCVDIMTTDVVSVEFGTPLNEAWSLLRRHHLKVLPVIDRARRVIGMISADDFLQHVAPDSGSAIADNVRRLLRASPSTRSTKPEVVGQIMSGETLIAHETDPISRIARILSNRNHPPAIPVVDERRKLTGIIGQTDLLAALYHARASGLARAGTAV